MAGNPYAGPVFGPDHLQHMMIAAHVQLLYMCRMHPRYSLRGTTEITDVGMLSGEINL